MLLKNQTILNNSSDQQTIIAQCTPQGPGAICLLRLSGIDAIAVAQQLAKLSGNKQLAKQQSHTIHFGYVVAADGTPIDQVLFLLMKAPHTFTGQDVVEITCHNNQFLISAIIDRALQCGARLAAPGEFTQRAVELGKMDLVQAEAMHDLIHAQTAQSLKYNLAQLEGSLSFFLKEIEQALLEMLAFCEGSFEFLEQEDRDFADEIVKRMTSIVGRVQDLLLKYPQQQLIKEGVRIALIGSVNVGKSSLFNSLVGKKRSIVTEIAGTTRDIVESGMYKDAAFLTFVDTAGLRQTQDRIEQEGIARSQQELVGADIVLVVVDVSAPLTDVQVREYEQWLKHYGLKSIVVYNKVDLMLDAAIVALDQIMGEKQIPWVRVSAKEGIGIESLHKKIQEKIIALKDTGSITYLLNARQHALLTTFLQQLQRLQPMLQDHIDYELVAAHLKDALTLLGEISGHTATAAVLDQVFKTFCVGK